MRAESAECHRGVLDRVYTPQAWQRCYGAEGAVQQAENTRGAARKGHAVRSILGTWIGVAELRAKQARRRLEA